jgi:hypothetical protein
MSHSRRTILQSGVAATILAVTPAIVASHPDADLIATCAEFDALERQKLALYDGPNAISYDDEYERATRPICERQRLLLDKLTEMRATTLDGHLVRIRSMVLEDQEFDIEALVASTFINERLQGMVLRDLAEQSSKGSASA